jgi:hypothetical protein
MFKEFCQWQNSFLVAGWELQANQEGSDYVSGVTGINEDGDRFKFCVNSKN